jgi:hypothetical protein
MTRARELFLSLLAIGRTARQAIRMNNWLAAGQLFTGPERVTGYRLRSRGLT